MPEQFALVEESKTLDPVPMKTHLLWIKGMTLREIWGEEVWVWKTEIILQLDFYPSKTKHE